MSILLRIKCWEGLTSQAKKHQLKNTYSNYDSILTYNETGYTDYTDVLDTYAEMSENASQKAGQILNENIQDMTARSGLALAGWRPHKDDMKAQAVEWWNWGMRQNEATRPVRNAAFAGPHS